MRAFILALAISLGFLILSIQRSGREDSGIRQRSSGSA